MFSWLGVLFITLMIPVHFILSRESDDTVRGLGTLIVWGWLGIVPYFIITHISTIGTLFYTKKFKKTKMVSGLLFPYFSTATAILVGVATGKGFAIFP